MPCPILSPVGRGAVPGDPVGFHTVWSGCATIPCSTGFQGSRSCAQTHEKQDRMLPFHRVSLRRDALVLPDFPGSARWSPMSRRQTQRNKRDREIERCRIPSPDCAVPLPFVPAASWIGRYGTKTLPGFPLFHPVSSGAANRVARNT